MNSVRVYHLVEILSKVAQYLIMHIIIFISLLVQVYQTGQANSLQAVTISTRLPSSRHDLQPAFDSENDQVYLFGGLYNNATLVDEVLRFSFATEQVEVVGKFPEGIVYGSAEFIRGYGLYLGGYTIPGGPSKNIWMAGENSNWNATVVGSLAESSIYSC